MVGGLLKILPSLQGKGSPRDINKLLPGWPTNHITINKVLDFLSLFDKSTLVCYAPDPPTHLQPNELYINFSVTSANIQQSLPSIEGERPNTTEMNQIRLW